LVFGFGFGLVLVSDFNFNLFLWLHLYEIFSLNCWPSRWRIDCSGVVCCPPHLLCEKDRLWIWNCMIWHVICQLMN
jgi:hypothetical protein